MRRDKNRLKTATLFVLALIAAITLLDFLLSEDEEHKVQKVTRVVQAHNNASRNVHYTYRVVSANAEFYVSREFASQLEEGDTVKLSRSMIFNVVNRTCSDKVCETYSLRWFTGVIIPLCAFLFIGIDRKFRFKSDTFLGVLLVVEIANVIGLLFLA